MIIDSEEDNKMEDEVFLDNGKPSHCHLFVPFKQICAEIKRSMEN